MKLTNTWLVQRLNKPYITDNKMSLLGESFSFGGGLKNGGLSEYAMKILRQIFSFDYMGSAEFEFGSIPKSFQNIAKNINEYCVFSFVINGLPVYVIGKRELTPLLRERIVELSKNKVRCKESHNVDRAIYGDSFSAKYGCDTIGWMELDNDFMFFISNEAFHNTAKIFGLIDAEAVQVSDTTMLNQGTES